MSDPQVEALIPDALVLGALMPEEVVGRPAPLPPAEWHRVQQGGRDSRDPRASYHAAWLRHLEAPSEASAVPLVSVVIPAFDANEWIADAVTSALEQRWPRIEVVVVDDGSSDPPDRVLPADPRLRVVRQKNAGVASARNRGVREARGELVHFLDADDALDPDCVALKMEALRRIPDAELCYASYRVVGRSASKRGETHIVPPIGDNLCPTHDLLLSTIRRYPFHTSSLLAARCLLLETGPMDESLVQGEDTRYWFQLGLRGAKVVAVNRRLGTRRFVHDGLTSDEGAQRLATLLVALLNLCDLLERPRLWPLVGGMLRKLRNRERWGRLHGNDQRILPLREAVLSRVAELGERGRAESRSVVPVAALLRAFAADRRTKASEPEPVFLLPMEEALAKTSSMSLPLEPADLEDWLAPGDWMQRPNAPALKILYAWVDDGLGQPGASFGIDALSELTARWPRNPLRWRWRLTLRLAPRLGTARAVGIARGLEATYRAVRSPTRAYSQWRAAPPPAADRTALTDR